jgi:hypothetical protein
MTGSDDKEQELTDKTVLAIQVVTKHLAMIDGVVTDVSDAMTTFSCTVTTGDSNTGTTERYSVPLRVLIGSQGSNIEIPVINSACVIGFRNGSDGRPQMIWADQIDTKELTLATKFIVSTQNNAASLQLDSKITMNGGKNGGVPLAKAVEAAGQADVQILSAILNVLGGDPINEPGNGAPSALQQALNAATAGLNPGDYSSNTIENPNVLQ